MIPVITGLFSLGSQWLSNRKEKSKAKHDKEITVINQAGSWDEIHARNSGKSWKDEWFTILLSFPLVGAFFPSLVGHIQEGFKVLDGMPEWYKAMLFLAVGASFGYRGIMDYMKGKK